VQIYGGYGFHEDYPVARAYRDSRINRIFEGTNEINRMLIVQMLMKRAMSGALPFFAAAKGLADEVMAGPSMSVAMGGAFGGDGEAGEFAEEEKILESSKKIFLQAAGGAVQKFREKLADEQETVGALANIVMDIYAMESVLRRTQKVVNARGGAGAAIGAAEAMVDAAKVFIYDASDRIEKEARTVLAATDQGDALRTQLAVLKRFAKKEAVDTIGLRRRVAEAVEARNRYPFAGY
jgi:alkylation response protein AidB-like acyl-CoA dehydrogenase